MNSPPKPRSERQILGEKDCNVVPAPPRKTDLQWTKTAISQSTNGSGQENIPSPNTRTSSVSLNEEELPRVHKGYIDRSDKYIDSNPSRKELGRPSPTSHDSAHNQCTEHTGFDTYSHDNLGKRQRESSEDVEVVSIGSMPHKKQRQSDDEGSEAEERRDTGDGRDTESTTNASESDNGYSASTAEILRLRLRLAMFKVKTDQTDVPFSELDRTSSIPDASHAPLIIRDATPESRFNSGNSLRSRPSPTLGKSAQTNEPKYKDWTENSDAKLFPKREMSSDSQRRTHEHRMPEKMERERPSTPESDDEVRNIPPVDGNRPWAHSKELPTVSRTSPSKDLTSSAVKGNAADSLLQLGGLTRRSDDAQS